MIYNFFRLNMPYGIKRNENGEWFTFNRKYKPLGWHDIQSKEEDYLNLPLSSKFKGLTDLRLEKIQPDKSKIKYGEDGKIESVHFYRDGEVPTEHPEMWDQYFAIIKALSGYEKAIK